MISTGRKHTAGMLRTFWSFDTLVFQTISKRDSCDFPPPLVLQRTLRSQGEVSGMTGRTLEGKWSSEWSVNDRQYPLIVDSKANCQKDDVNHRCWLYSGNKRLSSQQSLAIMVQFTPKLFVVHSRLPQLWQFKAPLVFRGNFAIRCRVKE